MNKKTFNNINHKLIIALTIFLLVSGFICNQEVTVSPPLMPPPNGFLFVKSIPSGSFIYLNGKNTGRMTPDSITYLDYGTYQVTLRKIYFKDTTITIQVKKNKKIDTLINYLQNPAMLGGMNLTSDPSGAEIFINDSSTGLSTPVTIHNLVPGLYIVNLKKLGFRDKKLNVAVESNKTIFANGVLLDTTVWVDYQVFNSGISSQTLTCVTVDQNNVKWIGSSDSGLISFDEKTFINFAVKNSPIPSDYITTITVAPDNKIWIGTENGFAIYNRTAWTIYNTSNSPLPANRIESIAFENNLTWIGTPRGLVKYDGVNWQVYTIYNSNLPWHWVNTISIDQNGTKWLGLSDSGIVSFDNVNFQRYSWPDVDVPDNETICSAVSPNNEVWFGFNPTQTLQGGLAYYNGNVWTPIYLVMNSIVVNNLFIDNQNLKWVSTNHGLVKIVDYSPTITYSNNNSPLTSSNVTGSVKDLNGNLWITTSGGGLNKFKGAN